MDRIFFETKMLADDSGAISALAWPFATPDRVGDMIEPGTFKSLKLPIPMLFGHDHGDPIGTWDVAGERSDGLHVSGKMLISEVARAREVNALVRAGAVNGVSISFITKKALTRPGGGRTIKALEMIEISLVTVGMHPGARVTSAKSAVEALSIAAAINRAAAQIGRK
ncbi:HK97 family phage prohead protease [Neorhizobium sp. T25_13]|uniref:HK97 family phage prohead protease n=1 Tax=Neorhizobium sp. T25_13 TaxID=2093830 RepID=UPI000CF9FC70|nr:HK97 family phage prohead protease [Neorhizobium sp. T25_13]